MAKWQQIWVDITRWHGVSLDMTRLQKQFSVDFTRWYGVSVDMTRWQTVSNHFLVFWANRENGGSNLVECLAVFIGDGSMSWGSAAGGEAFKNVYNRASTYVLMRVSSCVSSHTSNGVSICVSDYV